MKKSRVNSEFVALLKQANTDSSKMAEVIGVSEAQLRFVTNTQSGMGLMKCGNVVIPFDNTIESPRTFKGACLKYYSVLFVTTDQRTDQRARSAPDQRVISPADFSLHKNRISLHGIEFQNKSGDIKKEILDWNKTRGSRRRMLKIAICDDEQPIREYLKRLVEKCTEAEVSLFADGVALLADPTAFDLILLDISLNQDPNAKEPNGMETARKIRERSDALIIFVSALREYVFEGYDVGAFHYLLKPIDEQKFTEVMDRAIRQIRSKKNAEPLVIKVGGNYVRIPVDDIIYAENQARKIILHTKSKKEPYCFYEKMEVLEQKLGDRFFRSHRGFLVNMQEVARYDNSNIELKNGEKVFLAKQKYNDFVTAYMKYLRKA